MRTLPKCSLVMLIFILACAEPIDPYDLSDNNDVPSKASLLSGHPGVVKGQIDRPGDVDYFSFSTKGRTYAFLTLSMPDELNLDIAVYDSLLNGIDSATTGGPSPERLSLFLNERGTYRIKVSTLPTAYSVSGFYRLTLLLEDSTSLHEGLHLLLGNPSMASPVADSATNYLLFKDQYALSYNRNRGGPNWAAWHLSNAWTGETSRQNDFRSDASLPTGWYHVTESDLLGTGYDRGHLCPSSDRTVNRTDNSETFLMTNILPQRPDNNQGPWAELETYCRSLLESGHDLFIMAGAYGTIGTLASGKVNIPAHFWKVIVVVDEGTGPSQITAQNRVITVAIPNINGIRQNDWRSYRISVDQLEELTGYDFLSTMEESIETALESRIDNE